MGSAPEPASPYAHLAERCRQLGIPMTVQRRAVWAVLAARDDHPTAEQVYEDLRRRLPGVNRATAYRTLDKLVALGLAVKVSHSANVARYDAKTQRHHHLVCDACGAIADLESDALDGLHLPDLVRNGFAVRDFSVHVNGICAHCVRTGRSDERRSAASRTRGAREPKCGRAAVPSPLDSRPNRPKTRRKR